MTIIIISHFLVGFITTLLIRFHDKEPLEIKYYLSFILCGYVTLMCLFIGIIVKLEFWNKKI